VTTPIELRSDNTAGVAAEILDAVAAANTGSALAYGGDDWTERMRRVVGDVFEFSDVAVFPVVSGTAANSLGLSAMCPPWGAVLCHESAHIVRSEGGATSMFSGGAVMQGLPGPGSKLEPAGLARALESVRWGDPHESQPAVLSLTSPTDRGAVYSMDEVAALSAVARARGLKVHLDGARLANALVALGCTPADLTWRAGVDVVSLGAMKNGSLSTDAIVCFDPAVAEQLVYRTKRAGHVASKMRFQSAQIEAYLTDGRWLMWAANANARMAQLVQGLGAFGVAPLASPDANMAFFGVGEAVAARLAEAGLLFYGVGDGAIRLVTSFATTPAEIDDAVERWRSVLAG